MGRLLGPKVTRKIQQIFWVYLTNNFIITEKNDFKMVEPSIRCDFEAITPDNCFHVQDFRDVSRVSEYCEKLAQKEIGFFAECDGKAVGSIWATTNKSHMPTVVRSHIRLLPNEALIHDIVTGERFRGRAVGPFMIGRMCYALLNDHNVKRIVIDVNARNTTSLRMMNKTGLHASQQVLYICALGKFVWEKLLKEHC